MYFLSKVGINSIWREYIEFIRHELRLYIGLFMDCLTLICIQVTPALFKDICFLRLFRSSLSTRAWFIVRIHIVLLFDCFCMYDAVCLYVWCCSVFVCVMSFEYLWTVTKQTPKIMSPCFFFFKRKNTKTRRVYQKLDSNILLKLWSGCFRIMSNMDQML